MEFYQEFLFVMLIVLLGSFLQGVSGFGFGLFCVGLLSFVLPLQESTALVFALTTVLSGAILLKLWRYIVWRELAVILAVSIVGRTGGFWFLSTYGEEPWMHRLLGAVLLMVVALTIMIKRISVSNLPKWNKGPLLALILGTVGGFVSGGFASGGPFYVIYFLMRNQENEKYHAHLQVVFIIGNLFNVTLQGAAGVWNSRLLVYFAAGGIAVWLGTLLGLRLFRKLPIARVRQLAYIMICIIGLQFMFA